jgi:hypothetical protein
MYGQNEQAKAAEQAAAYNNQLALNEAKNRERETTQGIIRTRQNNAAGLSELRARLASSGVQTGTGTPLTVIGETAGRLELGIADSARAASMQAASLRAQGKMGLWEAEQNSRASRLSMAATGIQGLSAAFGKYSKNTLGIYPKIGNL